MAMASIGRIDEAIALTELGLTTRKEHPRSLHFLIDTLQSAAHTAATESRFAKRKVWCSDTVGCHWVCYCFYFFCFIAGLMPQSPILRKPLATKHRTMHSVCSLYSPMFMYECLLSQLRRFSMVVCVWRYNLWFIFNEGIVYCGIRLVRLLLRHAGRAARHRESTYNPSKSLWNNWQQQHRLLTCFHL